MSAVDPTVPAGQPHEYRRRELVEPDWTRCPAGATSPPEQWESAQWQRVHCVKNIKQLRALIGDLLERGLLRRPRADQQQFATMSMLVPPQMINTMVPHAGARTPPRSTPTRSGATCSRSLRPADRLALAPVRDPRLAARARHVGGRGPDPPLPDQGARRAASRPARSTAATAPGWTWSATRRRRSTSSSSRSSRSTATTR